MNSEIENINKWQTLINLNQLYLSSETKSNSDTIYWKYLHDFERVDINKFKSKIVATEKFKNYYETKIQNTFEELDNFIKKNEIKELTSSFLISDIIVLIQIEKEKQNIVDNNLTRRQISSRYFKNGDAKYLKGNLEKAVKQVLYIKEFPEDNKEKQFISILYSKKNATKILLCENEDRLLNPRMENTNIWHVGGKNTAKLKYVPKPEIPIYYLCDWDYDGLKTYLHIKNEYFNDLQLIIPNIDLKKSIEKTNHKSVWKNDFQIKNFKVMEQNIIKELIPNYWIEEESINRASDE